MTRKAVLVEQTDRELEEYRKALKLVSARGRDAIWFQIDQLLDRRLRLSQGRVARVNVDPE